MQETPGAIPGSGRSAGEGIGYPLQYSWASLVGQLGKNLPAVRETWVQSLGWEDPLEKGKATLPTPVFWPGEFHGHPWGCEEADTTEQLSLFTFTQPHCAGELTRLQGMSLLKTVFISPSETFFLSNFCPCHMACSISVPQSGFKPRPQQ